MRVLDVSEPPFDTFPAVSRAASPAHRHIEAGIEALVHEGSLRPGDRLPPESQLAAHLSVSRMTLRQALAGLEEKLMIQRRRGRGGGTFVREPRVEHDLTGLPGFTEQMRRSSVRPGGEVVAAELVDPGDDVRTELRLGAEDRVYRVLKVRLANDDPIALEETYLPARVFPGLLDRDLDGSLYEVMSNDYGQVPASATEEVEPATASVAVAELIGVAPGALLMRVVRTTETADGTAVEHARDLFRADRTRITMRSRISAAAAWGAASPAV